MDLLRTTRGGATQKLEEEGPRRRRGTTIRPECACGRRSTRSSAFCRDACKRSSCPAFKYRLAALTTSIKARIRSSSAASGAFAGLLGNGSRQPCMMSVVVTIPIRWALLLTTGRAWMPLVAMISAARCALSCSATVKAGERMIFLTCQRSLSNASRAVPGGGRKNLSFATSEELSIPTTRSSSTTGRWCTG